MRSFLSVTPLLLKTLPLLQVLANSVFQPLCKCSGISHLPKQDPPVRWGLSVVVFSSFGSELALMGNFLFLSICTSKSKKTWHLSLLLCPHCHPSPSASPSPLPLLQHGWYLCLHSSLNSLHFRDYWKDVNAFTPLKSVRPVRKIKQKTHKSSWIPFCFFKHSSSLVLESW